MQDDTMYGFTEQCTCAVHGYWSYEFADKFNCRNVEQTKAPYSYFGNIFIWSTSKKTVQIQKFSKPKKGFLTKKNQFLVDCPTRDNFGKIWLIYRVFCLKYPDSSGRLCFSPFQQNSKRDYWAWSQFDCLKSKVQFLPIWHGKMNFQWNPMKKGKQSFNK